MAACPQIRLAERPSDPPTAGTFELMERPMPVSGAGEVLCRMLLLTLGPYMHSRISGAKSYARGVEPGDVMVG